MTALSSIIASLQIIELLTWTLFPMELEPNITLFSITVSFPMVADSEIQLVWFSVWAYIYDSLVPISNIFPFTLKQSNKPVIGTIINSVDKNPNKKLFENGYYSYSNQYSYFSYKYMPEETQNRYKNNDNISKINKISTNNSLLKKADTLLKKFLKWINEWQN